MYERKWSNTGATGAAGIVEPAAEFRLLLCLFVLTSASFASGLADCPTTFTESDLVAAADVAAGTFASMDAAGLAAGSSALRGELVCLRESVTPATVARIEESEALASFLDERDDRVLEALAGMLAADPLHQFPSGMLPDGHPLLRAMIGARAMLVGDLGGAMPPLSSGWFTVDGVRGDRAPSRRAAVLQQFDAAGAVVATHLAWPGEGFDWVVPDEAVSARGTSAPVRNSTRVRTHHLPLVGASVLALAGSALLVGLAAQQHEIFGDSPILSADSTAEEIAAYRKELEGMQGRAAAFDIGGYLLGGAGFGLGVVTVVTW